MLYAGETPLLIVENKIGSGIGEHDAEQTSEGDTEAQPNSVSDAQMAGTIDQLATDGHWLGSQCQGRWARRDSVPYPFHFTPSRIRSGGSQRLRSRVATRMPLA